MSCYPQKREGKLGETVARSKHTLPPSVTPKMIEMALEIDEIM